MPERRSLNLRPASARRLPKRYEGTESGFLDAGAQHQAGRGGYVELAARGGPDDGTTTTLRPDHHHHHHHPRHHHGESREARVVNGDSKKKKKKKNRKKRVAAADLAVQASSRGALSPIATTTSNLQVAVTREGARQQRRLQHRVHLDEAVTVRGPASPWAFPPHAPFWPFWGCDSDFESDMSTPLLSLSDIDWGSDDDGDGNGNGNGNAHPQVDKVLDFGAPLAYPSRSAMHAMTCTSLFPSASSMTANRVS
ncbi:hypothetical protein E4U55_004684 [Claviceps digitariae]|nr:hypothetical protein E4U55_004684 [Claviceps digitariae]